jgi:hypothetical protein
LSSFTAATFTVTDDWPAGIVTVGGTVASLVSLLASVTVKAAEVSVLRPIVAWVAAEPAASEIVDRRRRYPFKKKRSVP